MLSRDAAPGVLSQNSPCHELGCPIPPAFLCAAPGGPFKPYFGLSGKTRLLQPQYDLDWKRHPQICHPDRSVAKWRDLLFLHPQCDLHWKRHPQICHPDRSVAKWRDLRLLHPQCDLHWKRHPRICHPDRAWRSGGTCCAPLTVTTLDCVSSYPALCRSRRALREILDWAHETLSVDAGDQVVQLSSIFFYCAHSNPRHGQQRRVSFRTTAGNIPQGSIAEDSEGRNLPAFRLR
jgi:hypothetical protein